MTRLSRVCLATLALLWNHLASAAQPLPAGPYVPDVGQRHAVVAFELPVPEVATLTVRSGEQSQTIVSASAKTLHLMAVHNLLPARRYEYEISVPNIDLGEHGDGSFKTAALPGESFTFVVFGDTRPGENRVNVHHAALIEQIVALDPAFSLVLGDLVDDGSNPAHWHQFFAVERELTRRAALFPVVGDNDHAEGRGVIARYFPNTKNGYYSFVWGGVYFFGLHAWDTKGRQPPGEYTRESAQYGWLEAELGRPEVQRAPFRVVFLHDPVFISRGRAARLLQETWAPLLEKGRVELVFSSWHLYERSRVRGVNYIISGGGGAELIWNNPNPDFKAIMDAKQHHFCRVDVGAYGLTLRAIAEDGTVLDRVSLATNVGAHSRDDEFSRFANRMAVVKTHGPARDEVVPVYVFDARDSDPVLEASLREAAEELDVTVATHFYDLRKRGVFALFLNAQSESNSSRDRLPAVFVGNHQIHSTQNLREALSEFSTTRQTRLFVHQTNLDDARQRSFASLSSIGIMVDGLRRNLTVGGLLWLVALGAFLVLAGRRGRSAAHIGLAALGAALFVNMVWGFFYFSIVKLLPTPDLLDTLLGLRERSPQIFVIQEMLGDAASRSNGMKLLTLRSMAFLAPGLLVVLAVARGMKKRD